MNDIFITILILNTQIFMLYVLWDFKELKEPFSRPEFKKLSLLSKIVAYIFGAVLLYLLATPALITKIYSSLKNKIGGKQKHE